jgi:hypothetical protein
MPRIPVPVVESATGPTAELYAQIKRQLVDISLAVAVITFTNVFNRINSTELDYSAVA